MGSDHKNWKMRMSAISAMASESSGRKRTCDRMTGATPVLRSGAIAANSSTAKVFGRRSSLARKPTQKQNPGRNRPVYRVASCSRHGCRLVRLRRRSGQNGIAVLLVLPLFRLAGRKRDIQHFLKRADVMDV